MDTKTIAPVDPGEGWELLPEGTPLKDGDGFIHPDPALEGRWIDFVRRPGLFRGGNEYAHDWPWRRKKPEPALSFFAKGEQLRAFVRQWVTCLCGRFHVHLSDAMLSALLIRGIHQQGLMRCTAEQWANRESFAYAASIWIFENCLEHGCNAQCNGHHVAQDFAAAFKGFEYKAETP